jgi:16S rRNA (guanine966-N2)-methyltransferase
MGGLRPTPDAMRERAFAVLGARVEGARFLDLYAGTGAVALEALSRGAAAVVMVEKNRSAARLVEANLASLGVAAAVARLMVAPAARALGDLGRKGAQFDLAWADPPFETWEEGFESVRQAFASGVLHVDATACLECPARAVVTADDLEVERDLLGGASRVVMLRCRARSLRP